MTPGCAISSSTLLSDFISDTAFLGLNSEKSTEVAWFDTSVFTIVELSTITVLAEVIALLKASLIKTMTLFSFDVSMACEVSRSTICGENVWVSALCFDGCCDHRSLKFASAKALAVCVGLSSFNGLVAVETSLLPNLEVLVVTWDLAEGYTIVSLETTVGLSSL